MQLLLYVLGATIGAGIFVLPGTTAALHAGPGVVVSFLIGGLVTIAVGLAYVEFAAMAPVAGSAYTYSYIALGEMIAWIIGWDLLLNLSLFLVQSQLAGVATLIRFTICGNSLARSFNKGYCSRWGCEFTCCGWLAYCSLDFNEWN